ncbi:MAG: nitrogenase associated protein N [Methanosarcinales archaeon]|nr:nitrogenase associated protein N [Methanosarcinales archaeon]
MTERNFVTVNPCVMCQPMGSVLAFKGVENSMVLMHGSQGCSTYMRLHLAHHFREPVDIASSSLSERGAVYGGSENLKKGLHNVIDRYHPSVIGVATTCMAETIGDDVPNIIQEFKEENGIGDDISKDIQIIPVSTPSYSDSHVNGYIKALDAIVRHLTRDTGESIPNGKVNIIPTEHLSPADIRELKQIATDMPEQCILLPDISDTFDAPIQDDFPKIALGGTSISDIADMVNSSASLGLGSIMNNPPVDYLAEKHGVPGITVPLPIGLKQTDLFFDALSRISGSTVPDKYVNERGRLIDAMVDVHKYLYGVRVALYGDPEKVRGMVSLMLEVGMHPVLMVSGSKSPDFKRTVESMIKEARPDCDTIVLDGVDFDTFNDAIRSTRPDLLVGDSNGKYISKAEGIPLVRVGLPIHDRVGAQRLLMVGYRGAMELIDRITNTIFEAKEKEEPTIQMCSL